MATYPCQIPSLLSVHPTLAPLAAAVPEIGISEPNGSPLRPAAVSDARLVVDILQAARVRDPDHPVTLTALDDAHTRKTVLETLHGANTFMGGLQNALFLAVNPVLQNAINGIPAAVNGAVNGILPGAVNNAVNNALPGAVNNAVNNALPAALNLALPPPVNPAVNAAAINAAVVAAMGPYTATLADLSATLSCLMARLHNKGAENRNHPFQGIPKTIAGSGAALAAALVPAGVPAPQGTNNIIGSVCGILAAPTLSDLLALTHGQILTLVEFYNDRMGIVVADTISHCRAKVLQWMRYE
ncbi:hypothetical protein C8F04DRAFT_1398717 [Mycena alexandri]|uniref:Uncharacterized protein n=1 Tax=Mycena alexandri TaxID=1745969 RepID=A0AAD6SLC0_9AGAR|nr:hypothetical protein C8F04DRAFT_1398717 [Mycena alexandri]